MKLIKMAYDGDVRNCAYPKDLYDGKRTLCGNECVKKHLMLYEERLLQLEEKGGRVFEDTVDKVTCEGCKGIINYVKGILNESR